MVVVKVPTSSVTASVTGLIPLQRRDLDPFFCQFLHDRAHLIGGEDEIAHDQRLIPLGSKGEPGAERQRRLHLHAIENDLEIGARKANAVDTAGHLRAGFAEGLGNLTPITFNREGRGRQSSSDHQT
jgi:hypothetical protein